MQGRIGILGAVSWKALASGAALASGSIMLSMPAFAQAGGHQDGEIVITAAPLQQSADETATPVLVLSGDELIHRRGSTLGETLSGQPGVNFDNFGGGASRPVIRGQASPRVQVLSDSGNIQDASSVSPDHNVAAEPLLLRGIEVLRGPASLLYGSGAIGGAVNLIDEKIPTSIPKNGFAGVAEGRLGTADGERSVVGGVTLGVGSFALRLEGVNRNSDDYQVPDKFGHDHIAGTFNDTSTYTIGGSWVGSDGYLGAAYTRLRGTYGVPGHDHDYASCHAHGVSLHCGAHGGGHEDDHDHDHDHEDEVIPVVQSRSDRFDIRSDYRNLTPWLDRFRFRMSFTDYLLQEYEADELENSFINKAFDVRAEFTHAPIGGLHGTFGIQHSDSKFRALNHDGVASLDTNSHNTALFAMESLQVDKVRFELALRQEWQRVESRITRYAPIEHSPFSASGAAVWDIDDDYSLALAFAHTQRAPTVQELYAYGVHLATNTYEIGLVSGNSRLAEQTNQGVEKSNSINLTLRKRKGATTFTLGAYHQDFSNYIYGRTIDQFESFRLLRYVGAEATFTGIDGELRHKLNDQFAVSMFGDYVRAKLKDGAGDLPRIPAARLGGRMDAHIGAFTADAEYYHVFKQGDHAAYETATPGYDMVNATIAYRLDLGEGRNASLFLRGSNLANVVAYNHSSFVKEASPLRGRNLVIGLRAAF